MHTVLGIHGLVASNTLPLSTYSALGKDRVLTIMGGEELTSHLLESHNLFTKKPHLFILVYIYHDVTGSLLPFTHMPL